MVTLVIPACRLSSWYNVSLQRRSRCLTLWTLSEHWHCVESYDGRRIRKDLKYPCPSRSWWIVEAVAWYAAVIAEMVLSTFTHGPGSEDERGDEEGSDIFCVLVTCLWGL